MEHQSINFRLPRELLERLDAEVAAEAVRTGLRIDRSQIIRRTLALALPALKKQPARKVAAK